MTSVPQAASSQPDIRERVFRRVFRLVGPLVQRLVESDMPSGINVLLTVRGRRSGKPRSTPVALLELDDREFVQASFGEAEWVANLRAAGKAVLTRGREMRVVAATELTPAEGGRLMRDALAAYPRRGILRSILGPTVRPPVAVLHRYRFRIDDTLDEYVEEATRHPLFELQPAS